MAPSATSPQDAHSTIAPFHTALNGVNQPVNLVLTYILWGTVGFIGAIIVVIRLVRKFNARQRLIATLYVPGEKQGFWKWPLWSWSPVVKKHLLYAPLWRSRHARKFHPFSGRATGLVSRLSFGALPTRLHTILLTLFVLSNMGYMLILTWDKENKYSIYAELRGRSGTLSVANLIVLVIFAGRNNPLIRMLNINFDTYNLMHRWIGRTIVIEVIIHIAVWAVVKVKAESWSAVGEAMGDDLFIRSGTVGAVAMVLILVLSMSPIRSAFYETFLNVHIVLALVSVACAWIHIVAAGIPLPQLSWVVAAVALWCAERLARVARLVYLNTSRKGFTDAIVEPMPGTEACRVTMRIPKYVDIQPGSHAYIRIGSVRPWENHPFSIAWVDHETRPSRHMTDDKDTVPAWAQIETTTVSFIVGAQGGFTRSLYEAAQGSSFSRGLSTKATFEGPYGGVHSLDSYGHAVLFAGATGITHQLGFVRHLVRGYGAATVSTRRILLVWVVRDMASLEWVRPWLEAILGLPGRRDVLEINIFVTRGQDRGDGPVPGADGVVLRTGRPDVDGIIRREIACQMGAMCVTVCGPGGLGDTVREGVRKGQGSGQIVDFVEESFTW